MNGLLVLVSCGGEPWPVASEHERGLRAALQVLTIYQKQFQKNRNRLESLLARHWPELPRVLDLGSVTLLSVLIEFGSAAEMATRPEEARKFMRRTGGMMLSEEKIADVVEQAFTSFDPRMSLLCRSDRSLELSPTSALVRP